MLFQTELFSDDLVGIIPAGAPDTSSHMSGCRAKKEVIDRGFVIGQFGYGSEPAHLTDYHGPDTNIAVNKIDVLFACFQTGIKITVDDVVRGHIVGIYLILLNQLLGIFQSQFPPFRIR